MKSATVRKHVLRAASVVATLSLAGGCAHHYEEAEKTQALTQQNEVSDINIVDAVRDSGVKAAIISQHTIFPYHFVQDQEALNELGQRDLAVLAARLRSHAGDLNIPRDGTAAALYDARVQWVMDSLHTQGVSADHVHIIDGIGGTASAPSEDVVRELRSLRVSPQMQSQAGESSSQSQSVAAPTSGGQQ